MPTHVKQLLQRGTGAFEAGRYAEAETFLLQVAEQKPEYANVYHMLGVIAGLRGAPEKAVALFRRALALNPTYGEARLNLAITLADIGAYEAAAEEADTLRGREPGEAARLSPSVLGKLANAHADLARKYHALGMYADAVGEYDKALGLCPNFPDLHNGRAVSCRELGNYAGAEASLARALELNPRYAEAYVNLGRLHQQMGNPAAAIAAWERALELHPTHPLARIYVSQATAPRAADG
jgi:tetratricopeptide (TPR) repeat protein